MSCAAAIPADEGSMAGLVRERVGSRGRAVHIGEASLGASAPRYHSRGASRERVSEFLGQPHFPAASRDPGTS
jgi:hypothetical protein